MICRSRGSGGFATVTLMLFLPLLALLGFALGFTGYLIQYKTRLRSTCLNESISLEKKLIHDEENLFRLNPLALLLRRRLQLAQIELAAAIASGNTIRASLVEAKIMEIQADQQKLDETQKALIETAKQNLLAHAQQTVWALSHQGEDMQSLWSFYLQGFTRVQLTKSPAMAVVADSPDPAPVYELARDFVEQQRVAYQWQHRFQTQARAQTTLSSENTLEMECAVSARKEKQIWTLQINADKP